ncbi:MAG: hypothetical protein ACYC4R_07710 [Anaerolineae bacterium]
MPIAKPQPPESFAIETFARTSLNYLGRMVDADGLPYFNIFWTHPGAEAGHDWPDFGDVMTRQLQGIIMARHMTGEAAPIEATWLRKTLELIDPASGLLMRPQTTFSEHAADMGDAALTLFALVTAYMDSGDPALHRACTRMVDGLWNRVHGTEGAPAGGFLSGFAIKSLMACARALPSERAFELAGILVKQVWEDKPYFSPDNTFRHGGHMHGNLRTLVGTADYALAAHDPILFSRVEAVYRYVRSEATRFGFIPEVIGRHADVVLCETCALMDYMGLIVTLANNGHPEYWGDAERLLRNHLVESQVRDISFLANEDTREDTYQFSWRDIGPRIVGAWAGWSSPNHILAAEEFLHWGGPELAGKTRLLQNCCGGSGVHALFIAWKNAARFENGCLHVHMHIDKRLPEAVIRCQQPHRGLLTVDLTAAAKVRVRIPEFVQPEQMQVEIGGQRAASRVWGNYLEIDEQPAGTSIAVSYPLPVVDEEFSVGCPGFRQYHYRAMWKGDTVLRMDPIGNEYRTGYSDFEHAYVPVYYGVEGPGPLYQREGWFADQTPTPSDIQMDKGALDLWWLK